MATVKLKFRPSTVADRPGTIVYFITHRRIVRQITTEYKVFSDEWDEKMSKLVITPDNERAEFVRTNQSAGLSHGIGAGNRFDRLIKIAFQGVTDKFVRIAVDGAGRHAGLVFTVETAIQFRVQLGFVKIKFRCVRH